MYHSSWQQWPQGVGATSDFAVASAQPAVGLGLVGLPAQASTAAMDYQQQLQYGAQFGQFQAQGVPVGFGQWPAWGTTDMAQWTGQFPAATALVPGLSVPDSVALSTTTTTSSGQTSTGKTDTTTSKAAESAAMLGGQWTGTSYNYNQPPPPVSVQQGSAWGHVDTSSAVTSATWTSQPPPPPPPAQAQTQSSLPNMTGTTPKPPSASQPDGKVENQSASTKDAKQSADDEEQVFEQHFKDWESQFQSWREQNKNHPDKEAYQRYENQWQEWHQQLLARREQMRSKKNSDVQGESGKTSVQGDLSAAANKTQDMTNTSLYGHAQAQMTGSALQGTAMDASAMGASAMGLPGMTAMDPTALAYSGMSPSAGLGARQSGVVAGLGLGLGMGQPGVAQGMGTGMIQPGLGIGIAQPGMGLGMGQVGLGLAMGQTPMAHGIPQPGMGIGMVQPGMGLGMGPGLNQPGMAQPGVGSMGQPGMGLGMGGSKGPTSSGMDQQGMGRMYDDQYGQPGKKPGFDRKFDRMDNWKEDGRPWDRQEFPNQQRSDMMRQGAFGKDSLSGKMDSQMSRSAGFEGRNDFPGPNDRMRDWNYGPDGPADRFSGGRDTSWSQADEGSRNMNTRGPMGDHTDNRQWNKPNMDLPNRGGDRPPWNRNDDYMGKPGFDRSDPFEDRTRKSEFDSKRSKFPVDFPEKAPEEYGMWPGEDEWNADEKDESEKKDVESSKKDDWDGKRSRFDDGGDDWGGRGSRRWPNEDEKGASSFRQSHGRENFRQSGMPDDRWDRSRQGGPGNDRWPQDNFDPDRRQGLYGDQRGREFDQRQGPGRDFNQRGREFDQRGRDFDQRGREFDQRGRDFDQGGKDDMRGREFDQRGRDGDQWRKNTEMRPFNENPNDNFNKGGPQFGQNSRSFQDSRQEMPFNQGGKGQFDQGSSGNLQKPFGSQDPMKATDQSQAGPPFPDTRGRPDMPFNQDMQNRFGPNRGGPQQQQFPQDSKGPSFMDEKGRPEDMRFNQGGMGQDLTDMNRGTPFRQEPGFPQQGGPNQRQQGGPNQRRNEDFRGGQFGDERGGSNQQGRFGPGGNFRPPDSQGPFGNDRPGFNQGPTGNDPQGFNNDPMRGNSRFDNSRDANQQGQFGQGPMSKQDEKKPPFGGPPKDDTRFDNDPKFGHGGPRNEPPRFGGPMDQRRGPPDSRFGDNQGPGFGRPGQLGPNDSNNKGRFGENENQNRMLPFKQNEQTNKMPGAPPAQNLKQDGKPPAQSQNKKPSKDDSGFCGDLDISFDKWTEEPIAQKKQDPSGMMSPPHETPGKTSESPARKRISKWGPVEDSKMEAKDETSSNQSSFAKPPTPPHVLLKEEKTTKVEPSVEPVKSSSPIQPKKDPQPGPNSNNQDKRGSLLGVAPSLLGAAPNPPGFQGPRFGNPPSFNSQPQPFGAQGPRPPRGPRPPMGGQVRPFGPPGAPSQPPGGAPQVRGLLPTPNQVGNDGLLPTPNQMGNDGLLPTPNQIGNDGLLPTPNQMGNDGLLPTPSPGLLPIPNQNLGDKTSAQMGPQNQSPASNKNANQKMDVTDKKPLLPPPTSKAGEINLSKNPFLSEKEQEILLKATEEIKEIQKFKDRIKGLVPTESADSQSPKMAKPTDDKTSAKEDISKAKSSTDGTKSSSHEDTKQDHKTSVKEESKKFVGHDSKDNVAKSSQNKEAQKTDNKMSSAAKDKASDRGGRDSDRHSRDRERDRDRDRDVDRDLDRRRDHDSDRGGRGRGRDRPPMRSGYGHGNDPDCRGDSKMHPDDPYFPGKRRYPFGHEEEEFGYGRHPGGNQYNMPPVDSRMMPGPLGMEPGMNRRFFREIDYGHRAAEAVLGHTVNEAISSFASYGSVDIYSGPLHSKASVETFDYGHGKIKEPELFVDDRYLLGKYDAFSNVKEGQQAFLEQQALERPRERERPDYHDDYHRYKDKPKHDFEKYDIEKAYDSPRSRANEKESKEKGNTCLFPSAREQNPEVITITDLLCPPGRNNRPQLLVVILRGPPGSGKTHLAKLIKDQEIENGGTAPRMLCLDDYFMLESERTVQDPETGKRVKEKEFKYEYEADMEDTYRQSLLKVFKKTVDDKFFPFIIVDSVNMKTKHYEEFCVHAKQKGFQVYIGDMDCMESVVCHKRNVHKRSLEDIMRIIDGWEATPNYFHRVDMKPLLQELAIPDVEMEEQTEEPTKDSTGDAPDTENLGHIPSKWETMEATEAKLDRLDGLRGPKRKHSSMEDYLQLPDDYAQRKSQPGKKRVRWADIEEHKEQDRLRAIGFVVGQTNWDKLTDPTHADRALTRTKYF